MNDSDLAQVIAAAVLGLLLALLYVKKRWVYVARTEVVVPPPAAVTAKPAAPTNKPPTGATNKPAEDATDKPAATAADTPATTAADTPATPMTTIFRTGDVVPMSIGKELQKEQVRRQRRTWLAAIVVGADNRTSTSKTIVFAWTLAVAWGLLSLLFALWLGDDTGWKLQNGLKLQDDYLLLLGGPYAAAVLAKGITSGRSETKTEGEQGKASPAQLVTDDRGDAELGDLQYTLFNVIALLFFIGAFIGDTEHGFPDLPGLLSGLALTSVAGYSAKKFLSEAAPKMTSVVPPKAPSEGEIKIFGTNLTVPEGVSETGAAVPPSVTIGGKVVSVTAHDRVLGNDRLTLELPAGMPKGSSPITVTRADGAAATTPAGENVLAFEVT